jgi:hypothetical protein
MFPLCLDFLVRIYKEEYFGYENVDRVKSAMPPDKPAY